MIKQVFFLLILFLNFSLCAEGGKQGVNVPFNKDSKEVEKNQKLELYQKLCRVKELKSRQGVRIFYMCDRSTKIVNVRVGFLSSGSAYQKPFKAGVPLFYVSAVFAGTLSYKKLVLEEGISRISAKISAISNFDNIYFSLTTPKIVLDEALSLFSSVICEPSFDEKEVEIIHTNLYSEMQNYVSDRLPFIINYAAPAIVYKGHPYEAGIFGKIEDFAKLSIDDLKKFKSKYISPNNAVAAVFGDISEAKAVEIIDGIFSKIPKNNKIIDEVCDTSVKLENYTQHYFDPGPQTTAALVLRYENKNSKDRAAAVLAYRIIGGRMNKSRIFDELRNKQGLVYWGYIFTKNYLHSELAYACFATATKKAPKAINALKDLIRGVRKNGISAAELSLAKKNFKGKLLVDLRGSSELCDYYFSNMLFNFSHNILKQEMEDIDSVTLKDVNRVISKLLDEEKMLFIIIGEQGKEIK